jgi:aryl-alcohol dehydrogenase-like predicted oxidoreductase
MFDIHGPAEGSLEAPLTVLAELREKGLIRHIGVSNITPAQIVEARRIVPIVCVQNHYNLVNQADDAFIDDLARDGIAYVPFLFSRRIHATTVREIVGYRSEPRRYADAGCAGVASATLTQHSADSGNIFPQASSGESPGCGAGDSF